MDWFRPAISTVMLKKLLLPEVVRTGRALRVLVVEDQLDTAWTLKNLLQLFGCEVGLAADGFTALQQIEEGHPDVVILDIGLPGLDGWEVAGRVRQQHDKPPLMIAVTGYASEEDREQSRQVGIDAHLSKPVDVMELHQTLASYKAA